MKLLFFGKELLLVKLFGLRKINVYIF